MDKFDEHLIFIISQPRSASSMLQLLLNSHPKITSLPEPWLILPLVYTFKYPGVKADYNSSFAFHGLNDYLRSVDNGKEFLKAYLRD